MRPQHTQAGGVAANEAGILPGDAAAIIERICTVASRFREIADDVQPQLIRPETLDFIQSRIDENLRSLR